MKIKDLREELFPKVDFFHGVTEKKLTDNKKMKNYFSF